MKIHITIKKCLFSLLFITSLLAAQIGYVQGSRGDCELIDVDKDRPIYQTHFQPYAIQEAIKQQEATGLSSDKAKGKVGELVARYVFENGGVQLEGKNLVSITSLFRSQGCFVDEYLRDHADRGLDDIFVVQRQDGWIDQRYLPVFHEAKYDGRCNLILRNTATLCQQLSVQWIDGNLKKAQKRTQASICIDDQNEFEIQSCQRCKQGFQQSIIWLANKLHSGNFHRTASLLCANGTFRIYNVNGSK